MNAPVTIIPAPLIGELSPAGLEVELGQLIRECLQLRTPTLALVIAQQIDVLCAHPDYRAAWEQRCAYRRMAWYWRRLAWVSADATLAPLDCFNGHWSSAVR